MLKNDWWLREWLINDWSSMAIIWLIYQWLIMINTYWNIQWLSNHVNDWLLNDQSGWLTIVENYNAWLIISTYNLKDDDWLVIPKQCNDSIWGEVQTIKTGIDSLIRFGGFTWANKYRHGINTGKIKQVGIPTSFVA